MLEDDGAPWAADGQLKLDGFTYGRLVGLAPTTAGERIAWLDKQQYAAADFRPQPWEQIIGVLRAMGHRAAARDVAIAKQHRQLGVTRHKLRALGRARGNTGAAGLLNILSRWVAWSLTSTYGRLVGFGYAPARLFVLMVVAAIVFALGYWIAASPGTSPLQPDHSLFVAAKSDPKATSGASNVVDAAFLSLDAMLPIDLGYQSALRVDDREFWGGVLRWAIGAEVILGWIGSLLLVAAFTNLIKKD